MKTKNIILSLFSIILAVAIIIPIIHNKKESSQTKPLTTTKNTSLNSDNINNNVINNNDNNYNNDNTNDNTNHNTNDNTANNNNTIDYNNTGTYNSTSIQEDEYTIFYPDNIDSINFPLPLITWGNGMGTTPSVYQRLISHIVSHGFVVVASNSGYVGSGSEMISAIDYISSLNDNSNSTFYNKIDMSSIGATGHSLGGRGTLNAASNDSRIKCIVPIQPAGADDISKVKCPMFLITSTNDTVLASDSFVTPLYNGSTVPTIYASLSGEPHTAPVTCCQKLQGYITAFLSIYLKSDTSAQNLFIGNNSLLSQDSNWTNIQTKNY